jgi:hypothetical protein
LWQGEGKRFFLFCFSKVSSAIQNAKAKKLKNPPHARNSSICKIRLFALWQHLNGYILLCM